MPGRTDIPTKMPEITDEERGLSDGPASPITGQARSPSTDVPGSPAPKKSRAAAADQKDATKPTKRRAARACVQCRTRKVRCDVTDHFPCTNCKYDSVNCEVQESRRRKKAMLNHTATVGLGAPDIHRLSPIAAAGPVPMHMPSADLERRTIPFSYALPSHHIPPVLPTPIWTGHAPYTTGPAHPSPVYATNNVHSAVPPIRRLPNCFKPLPSRLDETDWSYLEQKGSLELAAPALETVLLQCYVELVHPFMPCLELGDFLRAVESRDSFGLDQTQQPPPTSLLLYQSVMFAGSAFLDDHVLIQHGFVDESGSPDRNMARAVFYKRAKTLFDLQTETDRMVLVQSSLMLSFWYSDPDDWKDTYHWMCNAIGLAQTMALQRDASRLRNESEKAIRLSRRVWWSCYVRDRLISLGMRRPLRIIDSDCSVPLLTHDEFEIGVLLTSNSHLGERCTLLQDTRTQKNLATLFIELSKLCAVMGQVCKGQLQVLPSPKATPGHFGASPGVEDANGDTDMLSEVKRLDRDLLQWHDQLPLSARRGAVNTAVPLNDSTRIEILHLNLMHMFYHTVMGTLHRTLTLMNHSKDSETEGMQDSQCIHTLRTHSSADETTSLAKELHRFNLSRFLPTSGVTVLLPAMVIYLRILSNTARFAEWQLAQASQNFAACYLVMQVLAERYNSGKYALSFLEGLGWKGRGNFVSNTWTPGNHVSHNGGVYNSKGRGLVSHMPTRVGARPSTPPPDTVEYLDMTEAQVDMDLGSGQTPPTDNEADGLSAGQAAAVLFNEPTFAGHEASESAFLNQHHIQSMFDLDMGEAPAMSDMAQQQDDAVMGEFIFMKCDTDGMVEVQNPEGSTPQSSGSLNMYHAQEGSLDGSGMFGSVDMGIPILDEVGKTMSSMTF